MIRLVASSCFLVLGTIALAGQSPPPTPSAAPAAGLSYRLEPLAEGVYCAIASGVPYYVSNSVVIVGDEEIAVVDPGASPSQARALRAAIRERSGLPVRFVVDTHFHFDHAFGNEAFPDALVIGHEATRLLLGPGLAGRTVASHLAGIPDRAEKMRADAAREADPAKRAELSGAAELLAAYGSELKAVRVVPPVLTFADKLTLWLGAREIRLLHLGRGHTSGDLVVFLPRERIVCTGDLFNGYIGYMGDAYVDEWADSLERLAALDFTIVVPGHGRPFAGKDAIAAVQALQRDLWRQVALLERAGVPAEQAAARVDLRAHAPRFPRFGETGMELSAVRRIYEVIAERAAAPAR